MTEHMSAQRDCHGNALGSSCECTSSADCLLAAGPVDQWYETPGDATYPEPMTDEHLSDEQIRATTTYRCVACDAAFATDDEVDDHYDASPACLTEADRIRDDETRKR